MTDDTITILSNLAADGTITVGLSEAQRKEVTDLLHGYHGSQEAEKRAERALAVPSGLSAP